MYGYCETEEAFHGWLRSNLRRAWAKHPVKLQAIQDARYTKLVGKRRIFHVDCEHCNKPKKLKEIEVNHKVACGNLTKDTFGEFAVRLLYVTSDDLELLCKPCHATVTYAERYGVSLEEAEVQKRAVLFSQQKADKQRSILTKTGAEPGSNALERREQYADYIRRKLFAN